MRSREELAELGATAILKRTAPAWWWLRKNFTLPAVLAIGGILVGSAKFLWSQHTAIRDLQKAVAAIEAIKAPDLKPLEARVNTLELSQAALPPRLKEVDRRLSEHDHKWARVEDAAEIRIPRRRRK